MTERAASASVNLEWVAVNAMSAKSAITDSQSADHASATATPTSATLKVVNAQTAGTTLKVSTVTSVSKGTTAIQPRATVMNVCAQKDRTRLDSLPPLAVSTRIVPLKQKFATVT